MGKKNFKYLQFLMGKKS